MNCTVSPPPGPPRGVANVTVTLAPAGGSGCTVAWDPPPAPAGERVQCAVLLTGQGVAGLGPEERFGPPHRPKTGLGVIPVGVK